jgi:hypothetical protein
MLEITDRDECIRTALFGNGITPMVCQEKGKKLQKDFLENKRRLLMHLKERGITMVLKTPRKQYE